MNHSTNSNRDDTSGFTVFSEYLKRVSGISLSEKKRYLVSSRMNRLLEKNSIPDLNALVKHLSDNPRSSLKSDVIDAMTTNETYWFRDGYPFEFFQQHILPALHTDQDNDFKSNASGNEGTTKATSLKLTKGPMRIWSAACSSGQEAYSLSIAYQEYLEKFQSTQSIRPLTITGTDVSTKMIEVAKSGVYDSIAMSRGLSDPRKGKFFKLKAPTQKELDDERSDQDNAIKGFSHLDTVKADSHTLWKIDDTIRSRVSFQSQNLMDSFNMAGNFDVIFCRNALIYFSSDVKEQLLIRLHGSLKTGGYLCLGSSESLAGASHLFDVIHCNPGIMYRAK